MTKPLGGAPPFLQTLLSGFLLQVLQVHRGRPSPTYTPSKTGASSAFAERRRFASFAAMETPAGTLLIAFMHPMRLWGLGLRPRLLWLLCHLHVGSLQEHSGWHLAKTCVMDTAEYGMV